MVAVVSLILEVLEDVVKLSVHPPGRSLGIRVRALHPVYSCAVMTVRRYLTSMVAIFNSHCELARFVGQCDVSKSRLGGFNVEGFHDKCQQAGYRPW